MIRHTGACLAFALALGGCYESHGRSARPPSRIDAGDMLDAGRDAGSMRDAGQRRDASSTHSDASDGSILPLPDVADAGFEPGTLPHDYYEFCMRLGGLSCVAQDRCCWHVDRRFPDVETCLRTFERYCPEITESITWLADRYEWNRDNAEAYLRAIRENGARCGPLPDWQLHDVLSGAIPRGADCTPPSLDSAVVWWVDYSCQPGLRCTLSGTTTSFTGTCEEPGGEGAPCRRSRQCDADHYCALHGDATQASPGVCARRRAIGEACTADSACQSGYCPYSERRCRSGRAGDQWCIVAGNGDVDR